MTFHCANPLSSMDLFDYYTMDRASVILPVPVMQPVVYHRLLVISTGGVNGDFWSSSPTLQQPQKGNAAARIRFNAINTTRLHSSTSCRSTKVE